MVALGALEIVYVVASVVLSLAGLAMVAMAANAYATTEHGEMLPLAIGFSLIVAAAIATTVSAFIGDFQNTISLLTVHNAIATVGYIFIVYSVIGR